jgi:hypothetical protein
MHIKEGGQLPACGPNTINAASATSPLISGVNYLFSGHAYNGKVYLEDNGEVDEDSGAFTTAIRTRRIFNAQRLGSQGRVNNSYMVVDPNGNTTTGGFTAQLYVQNTEEAEYTGASETSKNTAVGGLVQLWTEGFGETFDIEISKTTVQAAALRLHYIGFDTSPYGDSN